MKLNQRQRYLSFIFIGFKAFEITYASDYFHQLYELAEKLIKNDSAYVCHQSKGIPNDVISPWRDRSIQESIDELRVSKYR